MTKSIAKHESSKIIAATLSGMILGSACSYNEIDHVELYQSSYAENGGCLDGTAYDKDLGKVAVMAMMRDEILDGVMVVPLTDRDDADPAMLSFDATFDGRGYTLAPASESTLRLIQEKGC